MSFIESFLAYFNLSSLQWLCMVTLFIASVVTVLVYFVQYFFGDLRAGTVSKHEIRNWDEADALLNWALSLKSWRCQWKKSWIRALNEEAKKPTRGVQITFEEDDVQASDLAVSHVSSFRKSTELKNVRCRVVGEKLQASFTAARTEASSAGPQRYNVKISPLQLQLDLQMREVSEEVQVAWTLSNLEVWDLQLTPSHTQSGVVDPSVSEIRDRLRQVLCGARPSVLLSSRPAQPAELKDARAKASQVASPPKPPRAHDWKLLVKNIRVTGGQEDGAAGSTNPYCVLQLDDPPQKVSTSVCRSTSSPSWDQPYIFELSGRSKELIIQVLDEGQPQESALIGQVSVPFDLVKKQPKGQQTFALLNKDQEAGTLSTEFKYLEPSEVRSWQTPTPALTKKVEMDRTVMPCGTVVTTITAVKSKPGRTLPAALNGESPLKAPPKSKLSGRRVSEQHSVSGATVSKALSSSDTELLILNGTDPVAEAAIRQLHESAKQKLKSPVRKSTIIISGVAKTPLSQDDEMALMAGYAAAMDASMTEGPSSASSGATGGAPTEAPSLAGPREGPDGAGTEENWDGQSDHDPDADKKSALSLCISESGSKKSKEEACAKQTVLPAQQLPAQERQALLPPPAPAEGPGHEPVAQRPGVPGAADGRGEGAPHRHLQPHHQQEAAPQEQEQSQRLSGRPARLTPPLP
ncbi:C2 domain-containing protein 2 isoform X1 [Anguilla anguilla]|uniref:C2 domain-containing protein 2 isoform X1 n=1 Tax=Anguilla anguilla TaxID=7936 RepID=UPI0015A7E6B0|nr:C2 domain-containing protein 2 isoform X1 [Anguilla anguilla]